MTFPAVVSEEVREAGRDGSGVVFVDASACVGVVGAGVACAGAETSGAETVGVADWLFATGWA